MLGPISLPRTLGDHETVRLIGQGAVGYVLEVRSRATGAVYAAKLMKPGAPTAHERFRREAELLARCDRHPGIVKVHQFGETPEGAAYIIMDLVEGEGLDRVLEREGRFEPRKAAELARDVARALGYAHARGIVHRDVKPSNVLISRLGPRVTDFGIATAGDLETLTATGTFLGTARYVSPEQARGLGPAGPTADVFALGCVLHEALAGAPPVGEAASFAEVLAHLSSPAPFPDVRALAPMCPAALAAIVARTIEKDPGRRYADGNELAADLDRFITGMLPSRKARPRSRRGAAVVLALAALAALWLAGGRSRALSASARGSLERARGLVSAGDAREALAEASRAYTLALECRAARTGEAASLEREAGATLAAAAALPGADLASSIAIMDAVPGAPESLPADARLARASALLAVGRLETLAAEAAAIVSLSAPGPRRALALELLGDVRLARHETASALAAYGEALADGARPQLRLKRGGAAAGAGDDVTALSDLSALVPDLGKLDAERSANVRLAGFAPALYRRALATGSESDLEAAWRLAPPPAPVGRDVAARWLARAAQGVEDCEEDFLTGLSEGKMLRVRRPLRAFARAREADPSREPDAEWLFFQGLWFWSRDWSDLELATRAERAFLQEMPDEPFLVFLFAHTVRDSAEHGREVIRCCEGAIDRMRPVRKESRPLEHMTAYSIGSSLAYHSAIERRAPDEKRFRRVALMTGTESDFWQLLSDYYATSGMTRAALEALSHIPPGVSNDPVPRLLYSTRARAVLVLRLGRVDDAMAELAAADPDLQPKVRDGLIEQCARWEAALRQSPEAERARLEAVIAGKAYLRLDQLESAERVLALLGRGERYAELAPLVKAARAATK